MLYNAASNKYVMHVQFLSLSFPNCVSSSAAWQGESGN